MWKTRRIFIIIAVSAVVLTILVAIPKTRNSLFGLYRQQATFDGKPTSYWLAALIDRGRIRPNEASRILSEGKKAALPVLAEILRSNDSEAQTRAAFILGTIQPTSKECAALLMPSLASLKEPQAFHRVIGILIKCDREATLAALCDMFVQNTDPKQRLQITRSLARHGHDDKASIDALVRALSDPDKNVRNLVVSSLAEMADDPELILPDLQKLLNSPDSELVQTACACLSTMKSDAKPAIPALLGLLKSSDSAVRILAASAIKSAIEDASRHASITDEILERANPSPTRGSSAEIAIEKEVIEAMKALLKDAEEAARFYARTGDAKKALEAAQQAQAISPDNLEVLDALGGIQIAAGEKEQALVTYRKLATLQPKSPAVLYRLAAAQAASADQAAAATTLKKALALKPDFIDAQAALTGLEIRAGHFPEAMKIAREVQNQAAKSALGFVLEGDVLMAEKKFAEAARAYETADAIGKSGLLTIKMHTAYAQAGKPEWAERRLAQWLKQSPDDAAVRLYAADVSLKSGKYQNAIEHYEWLLQKQPDNVLALNNLAWAYQQVKDARALETAERAYKLKPDSSAVADTLGGLLVEQGDITRGVDMLQKAIAAAPDAHEIRYHLAQAWLKAGDKVKARNELEGLLATDSKFPQRAEAMNLLKQLNN